MDLFVVDEGLPVVVRDLGLGDAVGGQGCVVPGVGAVAIQLGPVALRHVNVMLNLVQLCAISGVTYIPSRCSIESLSRIVVALTMSSEEKDLVLHIIRRLAIQPLDFLVKSLPLGFSECFALAGIGAIDQAKVFLVLYVVKSGSQSFYTHRLLRHT